MAKIICIANQKGGVGKTTTSVNLSSALSFLGRKVLLIDMDPQGNASSGLGLKRFGQEANIYHVLIGDKTIAETIQSTRDDKLKLVCATSDLVGAEIELVDLPHREFRLKTALQVVSHKFDYIIIDCPPSLGLLTLNALTGADSLSSSTSVRVFCFGGFKPAVKHSRHHKEKLQPRPSY